MRTDPEVLALKRTIRNQKGHLQRLTDTVLIFCADVDAAVGARKDMPDDIGRRLAQLVGSLEFANDAARYHGLGLDFRRDDKAKAIAAARQRKQEGR